MSIDAGAQVAIILLAFGPCVVVVDYWDMFCIWVELSFGVVNGHPGFRAS